jgi:DUF971 family protein
MPIEVTLRRASKAGQTAARQRGILTTMATEIRILKVEKDGEDGVIVTFSDGTIGGYVVEELLLLRPVREAVKESVDSN